MRTIHLALGSALALLAPPALAASIYVMQVAASTPFDNSSTVINGYAATDVQAALEETHVKCFEVNDQSSATTTSGTDAVLTAMTVTPTIAGTYLVLFNTDISSNAAGAAVTISYYQAAAQVTGTQRKIIPFDGGTLSATSARGIAALQHLISFTGSNSVSVEWSMSNGTATASQRTLTACRVGL